MKVSSRWRRAKTIAALPCCGGSIWFIGLTAQRKSRSGQDRPELAVASAASSRLSSLASRAVQYAGALRAHRFRGCLMA